MTIVYRLTLDEETLRLLGRHQGGKGRATREEVRIWLDSLVESTLQSIAQDEAEDER